MTEPDEPFPPTLSAALARVAAVRPADYARSRGALDGAVTRLSPYLTHGVLSLPQVLAGVAARHRLDVRHKFVFELGWREFFRHVWQHRGDAILASLHDGVLPEDAYAPDLPVDVREGRTGVPVIDEAVRTLYTTGYLHNHARMWLASYLVHLRKVHWRAGADWLVAHLLDGDLASNHLSWQWVAGTGSSKPYLFNADNVERHAPAAWHSPGTVIDQSYEALDAIARSRRPVRGTPRGDGIEEPARHRWLASAPVEAGAPEDVAGRDVWLIHPWALGEPPADLPPQTLRIGLWPASFHDAWPWRRARWHFVGRRMTALAPRQWHADRRELSERLAGARSVRTVADPHLASLLPAEVVQLPTTRLFVDVDRPCASFSSWWPRATREAKTLAELPGLRALGVRGGADSTTPAADLAMNDMSSDRSLQ